MRDTRKPNSEAEAKARAEEKRIMIEAVKTGDVKKISEQLTKGVNVNYADTEGKTALHFAAENGHKEAISQLLEAGANIKAVDKKGNTALHSVIKRLPDDPGVVNTEEDIETIKIISQILLDNGVEVNAKDTDDKQAIDFAIEDGEINGRNDLAIQLIEAGARPNFEAEIETFGLSYLERAIDLHDTYFVWLLLEAGADANRIDSAGAPLLSWATYCGNKESVKLLLEHGANVNTPDEDTGSTPLHSAACNRCEPWRAEGEGEYSVVGADFFQSAVA